MEVIRSAPSGIAYDPYNMDHIIWFKYYDSFHNIFHIIYTEIISNVTSGIIIQPIVSFLEHIALAKSFSKREPQERILYTNQRNSRILMI